MRGPGVAERIKSMEGQPRDHAFSSGRGNTGRNELTIGPWPPFIARGSCRRVRGRRPPNSRPLWRLCHPLRLRQPLRVVVAKLPDFGQGVITARKARACRYGKKNKEIRVVCAREPVWPSGKALGLVSRRTSVRICLGSPFSSKAVVCGNCLVTLSLKIMKH